MIFARNASSARFCATLRCTAPTSTGCPAMPISSMAVEMARLMDQTFRSSSLMSSRTSSMFDRIFRSGAPVRAAASWGLPSTNIPGT